MMKDGFSENLQKLRKSLKINQQDVADMLGISSSQYGNYENGHSKPNTEILIKLGNYFNITMDELVLKQGTSISKVNEPPAKYGYSSIEELIKEKEDLQQENTALLKKLDKAKDRVIQLLEEAKKS